MKDSNDKKFDLVVVWKLNRVSRRLIDILNIVDTLDKNSIAFRSLTESFETETPAGKLQLNIMGAIGEFERGTIAEWTFFAELGYGIQFRVSEVAVVCKLRR